MKYYRLQNLLWVLGLGVALQMALVADVRFEWAERYGKIGSLDGPTDLALGPDASVVVTGYSENEAGIVAFTTLKYSTNGTLLWKAIYDSEINDGWGMCGSIPWKMAVDSAGCVYLTGYSWQGLVTGYDATTVKCDSNGNQQWVAAYDGPNNGDDSSIDVAADELGNVYVLAGIGNGAGGNWATLKYDSTGQLLWTAFYEASSGWATPRAMALDGKGNLCCTGTDRDSCYLTIKYDCETGQELWQARYRGPRAYHMTHDVAVDAEGYVYVTGGSEGSDGFQDYATVKYDPIDGREIWVARYAGPKTYDYAVRVCPDSMGSVFVTGKSSGDGGNIATICYDAFTGSQIWVQRTGAWPEDMKLDRNGLPIVVGTDSTGGLVTIKYDAVGNLIWSQSLKVGEYSHGLALGVAEDGSVYALGAADIGDGDDDYLTLKYSQNPENYGTLNAVVQKGQYNGGTLQSLGADDGDYWIQGAGYDPSDPLAVINSALLCETEAQSPAYGSGKVKVVEKANTQNAKFRVRAIKADGSYVVLADNVPSGFQDVVIERDFPQPVSDFIDEGNQNRLRLELRCASWNRMAGFFKHYIDQVEWTLTQ